MSKSRRESDLSADLYHSLYGNSRKLKPENIKAYVLYEKLNDCYKNFDNFVLASSDLNEISVTFNKQSDCKVFKFDKVFCSDSSQNEKFEFLIKATVQDVILGLHNFVIVCQLSDPSSSKSFKETSYAVNVDSFNCFVEDILRELLSYVRLEDNMDSSLHVSYFEVHDDKIIDFLKSSHELNDLEIFKISDQNFFEIKNLTEKPLVDYNDISNFLSKRQYLNVMSYGRTCCSVFSVSLIKKNVNFNGFEYIKVGKLTMVDFAKCNFSLDLNPNLNDWLLKFSENRELPFSSRYKIFEILKPAFGGAARTSILVSASPVLHSFEEDLKQLQFASDARKISNPPEIDLKLVVPNALKEYSDEIHELQKDLNSIAKCSGPLLESQMYRFYKNSVSVENEKIKSLNNILQLLSDKVNSKKQALMNLHSTSKAVEFDIEDYKKKSEKLKMELGKSENEDCKIKQISTMKVDEILTMKQMKISHEFNIKRIKSELTRANRNYEELTRNLSCLKAELVSLSCNKGAEQTSLRSTLELLMVDMNSTLSKFQSLQQDLLKKLDDDIDIDILLKTWQQITEVLLSKFSSFIHENEESFNSIQLISSSAVSLHTSQSEILEIIRNNRNEKWPVLCYYFQKVQIFCDSCFKTLTEITNHLDVLQNCYRAELKAIGTILSSSSKSYEKFINDMDIALKSYQQVFEEQKSNLSTMTNKAYFHHEFKKQFDENIGQIKHSIFALKQMCLSHYDATFTKWNEIQKDYCKAAENNAHLSDHLSTIHKEMIKSVDNISQHKLSSLDSSPIKERTENVESKISQLLQMQREMKIVLGEAYEVHQKGTNKEQMEVEKTLCLQKEELEKYFDTLSLKLKTSSRAFSDELRNIQNFFINTKDELKKNLNSLSSSIFSLSSIYDKYLSVSSFILEKSERSFKILPAVREYKSDNIPDFDNLILEDWKVSTSTPNIPEKKTLNVSYEREKLLSRLKSIVEQQISQKLTIFDMDSEVKEKKDDVSTMSLPNISTHLKIYNKKTKKNSKLSKR